MFYWMPACCNHSVSGRYTNTDFSLMKSTTIYERLNFKLAYSLQCVQPTFVRIELWKLTNFFEFWYMETERLRTRAMYRSLEEWSFNLHLLTCGGRQAQLAVSPQIPVLKTQTTATRVPVRWHSRTNRICPNDATGMVSFACGARSYEARFSFFQA
jgi:hypothetical protein